MNIERIKKDMEAICAFNRTPGEGYTRFSYSQQDRQAREYLKAEFDRLGLATTVDGVGNIRARLEGSDPTAAAVMVGSHIDTVLHGGKFDGLLGTIAALEVVRTFKERNLPHKHPIEIVIFPEEEGSNFGAPTTGSKFLVGRSSTETLHQLKTPDGTSMYDTVKSFGLNPEKANEGLLKKGDIKVMFEFHIEQSVVLESRKIPVGIVEAIAGMKGFEIVFEGVPNHAGATPMKLRHDALLATAEVAIAIEKLAMESPYPDTVGTVGRLLCEPNVSNIIPGKVTFRLDARDVCDEGIAYMAENAEKEVKAIAEARGLTYSMRLIGGTRAIILPKEITDALADCAEKAGVEFLRMNSGAVHDCCLIADVAPIGLIFVPSLGGRSHVPQEDTPWADIEKGVKVLFSAVERFAE